MTNCMSIDWKFFSVTGLSQMIGSFDFDVLSPPVIRSHVPESEPIKNITYCQVLTGSQVSG